MTLTPLHVTPERCDYRDDQCFEISLAYITPTSKGIEAWCMVRYQNGHARSKVLTFGRYDLMGARTVSTLVNQATDSQAMKDHKDHLSDSVKEAVLDAINLILNGPTPDLLHKVAPHKHQWLLPPLLESKAATRLVAPGGIGKSIFALGVSITVATGTRALLGLSPRLTGPVLYLDWEADRETHAARLQAICNGHELDLPQNLHYVPQRQTLYRAIHGIAAIVADISPVLVVVDSNAMARGSDGEGGAADATIRMFSALRTLALPALIVDHKSDEKMRRGKRGGYGSIFNSNLARLEWEVVRRDRDGGMVMELTKANNTRPGRELGFRLRYVEVDDRVTKITFAPVDPLLITGTFGGDEMAQVKAGQADLIYGKLLQSSEPRPVSWISQATSLSESIIRSLLSRHRGRLFEQVSDRRPTLWRAKDHAGDEGDQADLSDVEGDELTNFGR